MLRDSPRGDRSIRCHGVRCWRFRSTSRPSGGPASASGPAARVGVTVARATRLRQRLSLPPPTSTPDDPWFYDSWSYGYAQRYPAYGSRYDDSASLRLQVTPTRDGGVRRRLLRRARWTTSTACCSGCTSSPATMTSSCICRASAASCSASTCSRTGRSGSAMRWCRSGRRSAGRPRRPVTRFRERRDDQDYRAAAARRRTGGRAGADQRVAARPPAAAVRLTRAARAAGATPRC